MNYAGNAYIQGFQSNEHKYSQMNNEQWTHGGCRSTPMFFPSNFYPTQTKIWAPPKPASCVSLTP